MGVRIERLEPRCKEGEVPDQNAGGEYILVSPGVKGEERNKIENATLVRSLEKAADLVEKEGYSIRMVCAGKRPSLISPGSLRVARF
jgi:hypothetical protein